MSARRPVPAAALLLVGAFVAVSCDGHSSPTGPANPTPPVELNLELTSANFTLRYSEPTASLVPAYLAELEENLPRVLEDLDVTLSQRIVGRLYPDFESYWLTSGFTFGGGAASGPYLFHLVAIPYAPSNAVHEMAHVVTYHLSRAGGNPVWLWESLAIYEARQFIPPSSIPELVAGDFPTLAELNDFNHRPSIYLVGYPICELIVEEWGWEAVRQLVVSRGDIESVLGLSTAEFEARWRSFVVARYL